VSDFNPMDHDAPVIQLVRQVLHKDSLRDRVRKMRYRRRKPVEAAVEPDVNAETNGGDH
jgi:hypothetical protein